MAKHKSRKRRREQEDVHLELKLLSYAGTGRHRKLAKLLKHHPALDVGVLDAEGNTALHQACRHCHAQAAELLLSAGADARAEDFKGNTPAHLAAQRGHLDLLALLLQQAAPPDIAARNAAGKSVRELAAAAMEVDDAAAFREALQENSSRDEEDDLAPETEEAAWQAKLRAEAGLEDPAAAAEDDASWSSYGGFFAAPDPTAREDEDAYAQRIWREMQRRQRAARGMDAAAAARDHFREQREEQAAREKAQFDAAARSRTILEEERAKDRAWREAVAQGDLGPRRARYEARWHTFSTNSSTASVAFADVPWLLDDPGGDPGRLQRFVLYGAETPAERRKRVRLELMRWHPDKFVARFGTRLAPVDRERVLAGVKATSQVLTSLAGV